MKHRSKELAQARFPFAPGVIECPPEPESLSVAEVVLVLVCMAAVVAVVGFALGYVACRGCCCEP